MKERRGQRGGERDKLRQGIRREKRKQGMLAGGLGIAALLLFLAVGIGVNHLSSSHEEGGQSGAAGQEAAGKGGSPAEKGSRGKGGEADGGQEAGAAKDQDGKGKADASVSPVPFAASDSESGSAADSDAGSGVSSEANAGESPASASEAELETESAAEPETRPPLPDTGIRIQTGGNGREMDETEWVEMFTPYCTEDTDPAKWMESTQIQVDGKKLEKLSDFKPWYDMDFGQGREYASVPGVLSFRGDNFRNSPAYGYAGIKENRIEEVWAQQSGSLTSNGKTWSGSGWTGQPLIVRWPKETMQHMNLYDNAQTEEDLIEVIYACLDGYVYFLNLRTGKATRDRLFLGYSFKGAGALDPRGYPLLYVGSGYNSSEGTSRVFIVNLLDCSILYTFGNNDGFSLRGSLSFFDSSALVDAASDTLIYPGENGVLYLIKLNTEYDAKRGRLSISPEEQVVKWRYWGKRSSSGSYWVGMEDSAAIFQGYLFIADNGGHLMCLDLNSLELVWVQDILDDSNGSPVLCAEDGHLYLYISTSFHLGWRSSSAAEVPIWKIDAENGEIVWKTSYECRSESGVSGGVQSTIAAGKQGLSDYIYVTVAKTGGMYSGVLACLRKSDGSIVWEHRSAYTWSSPLCLYNEDGSGRVLYCNSGGEIYLLDGKTGKEYDCLRTGGGNIEASPAAYEDYVVIGSRGCRIYGLQVR